MFYFIAEEYLEYIGNLFEENLLEDSLEVEEIEARENAPPPPPAPAGGPAGPPPPSVSHSPPPAGPPPPPAGQ